MGVVTDTVLKTYFETGDFPSQSNFEDLIDSLFFATIQKITHTTTGAETKTTSISISGTLAGLILSVGRTAAGTKSIAIYCLTGKGHTSETITINGGNDIGGTCDLTVSYTGNTLLNIAHIGTVGETISWTTRIIYLKP